ncbi:MAG: hypothetical protein Q9178_000461 [Gyalolechia marmorata]
MDLTKNPSPGAFLAESRSSKTLNVTVVFGILEVLCVGLFLTSKYKSKTFKGMDTYMMIPAFATCFSIIIVNIVQVEYAGLGRHIIALSNKELTIFLKSFVALRFTYVPAVTFPKLSILALYLRIFTTKPYRYATYATAVFLGLIWLASFILAFAECTPFQYSWDKSIQGHCINYFITFRLIGGLNLLSDVAILILPLPVIWGLQTSANQKIGLTITFLTGSIGMVTAILRFVVFFRTDFLFDLTWYAVELSIWTTAETGLYLIAACLPSLRPLFKHIDFGALRSRLSGYSNKLFSRHTSRKETSLPGMSSTTRNSRKIKAVGVNLDRLHGQKDQASYADGNDQQGLVDCYLDEGPRTGLGLGK